jgi:hypothetical protein
MDGLDEYVRPLDIEEQVRTGGRNDSYQYLVSENALGLRGDLRSQEGWDVAMKKRTVLIVLIILASVLIVFVAKNHPFVDGNKRTAFLALGLFLAMNEWRLETTQIDAIETMLSLARGTLDEHALAVWIREKIVRIR